MGKWFDLVCDKEGEEFRHKYYGRVEASKQAAKRMGWKFQEVSIVPVSG